MKLCRYGPQGQEKPAMIDADGQLRDISSVVADITPEQLTPAGLSALSAVDIDALPIVDSGVRMGVPVNAIPKVIGIGLNYVDHAIESNLPIPTEPIVFMKAITSLCGPNDDVILPRESTHSDWEVELGMFIGSKARYVEEENALDYVAGYVLVNDVSERFDQKQRGTQWSKGKGHDTFCPVGPWFATPDELSDPQALDMFLDVNGVRMQTGNTRTMIFNLKQIIAYVSRFVTLMPGDLIITGTPPGVGEGKKPDPIFLKAGDEMHLGIDGLGEQRQQVKA